MPSFDIVVVGCGGGPFESNLSSYLLKTAHSAWMRDAIVGLEAGSGMGALERILRTTPNLFGSGPSGKPYTAAQIYSYLRCYLITHSHLDHVNSLVISAGSLGSQKPIYARRQTLKDLEAVFADRIWPKLASYEPDEEDAMLVYTPLPSDRKYMEIGPDISVCSLPLSHGTNKLGVYESSAFFIRNDVSQEEFLFFGDVEPDSVSSKPQTIEVWKTAAPKIPATLSTLFIECSWPSGRDDKLLYGHLSPEHLVDELVVLATEVYRFRTSATLKINGNTPDGHGSATRSKKKTKPNPVTANLLHGVLNGLCVYIIHCKDDTAGTYGRQMHDVITDQVRTLVDEKRLGAKVLAVEQGMHIRL